MADTGENNGRDAGGPTWVPDIYDYLDYRAWLGAYYTAAKANIPAFSYRYFARKAGFSSPNFLKLVIDGRRNLSDDSVARFAHALGLAGDERRFFAAVVAFNQAGNAEEKNSAFEQIAASRRFRNAKRLDSDLYEYLSHWYYPAIREMVARPDFHESYEWIASQLTPPITAAKAKQAITVLETLGLVVRNRNNRLERGDATVSTEHEVRSLAIGNYHRAMLGLAGESIERFPSAERHLLATTVCISSETVDEIKDRYNSLSETVLDLCDRDPSPERVYQLNFQLFPLSESRTK